MGREGGAVGAVIGEDRGAVEREGFLIDVIDEDRGAVEREGVELEEDRGAVEREGVVFVS